MKNNNGSNTLLKCIALVGCILVLKSLFSISSTTQTFNNVDLEEQTYSKQYKISKEKFNETDKKVRDKKVLNLRTKFKFKKTLTNNFNNRRNERSSYRRDENVNIADAPQALEDSSRDEENLEDDNDEDKVASIDEDDNENEDEDESEDGDDSETKTAKNDKDSEDGEDSDGKKKKDNDDKDTVVAEAETVVEEALENIESTDLSLIAPPTVEEAVSFITTEPLTVSKQPNSQTLNQGTSSASDLNANEDDETDSNSDDVATDSPVIPLNVDQTTLTVIETLIKRGDFQAIDAMLDSNSTDRRTTYYTLVEYSDLQTENNSEINRLLQKHFFNNESAELLSQHLVDQNVSNESKRISYSFLLQLVSSWSSDTGNSEQFSAIFIDGVSQKLTGPTDGSPLSADQELYLNLHNSIVNKFDEINLLSA